MKRVWIFNHDACSPSTGPMLRHYNFAKYLSRMGYKVTVFASNRIHATGEVIPVKGKYERFDEDGADFIRVKTTPYKGNGVSRIINWISYYLRLFQIADDLVRAGERPDIIMGSSVHPLAPIAANKISKKLDIPSIVEVRDLWPEAIFMAGYTSPDSLLGKFLSYKENQIYERGDSLVFTKPGDKDHILEMHWDEASGGNIDMDKIYYINNGVDLEVYQKQIEEYQVHDEDLENPDKFNIVYTGSLRQTNNLDFILDAAKLIQKETPQVQFIIYGAGNQLERLEQRLVDEDIKNVFFKGFVNKKYVPNILSKADCTLLNYSQNNYNWSRGNSSNKLFEYMASGKPIISTIKTNYSIISKYKCGIEIENYTAESLRDTIIKFIEMPDAKREKIGDNAKKAAHNFDFSNLSKKLADVIETTIDEYAKQKRKEG